jgi:hypothetical protein
LNHSMSRIAGAVAATLGVAMAAFGVVLYWSGCISCESGVPPVVVIVAGIVWVVVATLALVRRPSGSLTGALLLTSTHAGLLAFAGARACLACILFASAEATATLLLVVAAQKASGTRWHVLVLWSLGTGLAAFIGTSVGLHMIYPVLPTRVLGAESWPLKDPRTTVIYVLVHRGCGKCDAANDRMGQALEQGLPLRALIVDVRSELGDQLRREHRLFQTPAFIAKRGQQVLGVQDGETVDTFLRALERQGVW